MPEITFDQAKEFLDNITAEDKVAIIHHDDDDGFASGILYYDWCKNKKAEVEQFTYTIRKSKLKNFDLEKFNKVIVSDLASEFMAEELIFIKDKQVFYTDHHPREEPLPEEILELVTQDQGYLPSSRTAGELTGLKPWLSLAGTISDAGHLYPENDQFIKTHLKEIDMSLEEFKENVTSTISNFLTYFNKEPEKAFKILEKINSIEEISQLHKYAEPVKEEVHKFVEEYKTKGERLGNINYYYFEPSFSVKVIVANIISHSTLDETYIFATPKGENITFSARTNSNKTNAADLLKAGIRNLEDAAGGGHRGAAGGMIQAKDLEQFKNNIRNFSK